MVYLTSEEIDYLIGLLQNRSIELSCQNEGELMRFEESLNNRIKTKLEYYYTK